MYLEFVGCGTARHRWQMNDGASNLAPHDRDPSDTRTHPVSPFLNGDPSRSSLEVDGVTELLPENAPTVISNRPPLGDGVDAGLNPRDVRQSLAGQTLGHFELLEFVGGGGMGAVYRARDTTLGRIVAVKVVAANQTEEENLKRFRNEAQSAARLDHPNIAQVFYVGEDSRWNYIVFEFIEGLNVRELVADRGPLPVPEALSYTLQIADALEHSAQRNVTHRDIKPSNILVTPDGRAKLVDMGLARLRHVESSTHDLTASGVTLGTFDYISPEQARDPRDADVRSDIYSLGCTLYYMLTGSPPFPVGTVLQKLLSHSSDAPPDVREFRPDVSDEIAAILTKMLAKRPLDRFQEPSQLIGELLLTISQLNLPVAHRGGTVWITPDAVRTSWWERHLTWFVPLACLITVVLAVDYVSRPVPHVRTPRKPQFLGTIDLAKLDEPAVLPSPAFRPQRPPDTRPDPQESVPQESAREGRASSANATPTRPLDDEASAPDGESQLGTFPLGQFPDFAKLLSDSTSSLEQNERTTVPPPPTREPDRDVTASVPSELEPTGRLIHRVVVGDDPDVLADDALSGDGLSGDATFAPSLEEAWEDVLENPDVSSIELAFNGERRSPPLDLTRIKPDREISILAANGYTPTLLFSPNAADLGLGQKPAMIEHADGKITWNGVHFRFVLPSIEEARQSWALFKLDQVNRLAMRMCTLTIENANTNGDRLHDRVAFFEFAQPDVTDMMPDAPEHEAAENMIQLSSCVIRGEATLIRADEAVPFELTWQQGLFVSTEHLLWLGGARKAAGTARSYVELVHVTAIMDSGFAVVQIGRGHQPNLDTKCSHCILVHAASKPLFEHLGTESVEKAKTLFRMRGNDNFYPRTAVRWRLAPVAENARDYPTGALSQGEDWYQEQGASANVIWKTPPPRSSPRHTHTPTDYLIQADDGDLTSRGIAGFDPTRLPAIVRPDADPPGPDNSSATGLHDLQGTDNED